MINPRTPDSEEDLSSSSQQQKSRSDVAPKGHDPRASGAVPAAKMAQGLTDAFVGPRHSSGMRAAVQLPLEKTVEGDKPAALDLDLLDDAWDNDGADDSSEVTVVVASPLADLSTAKRADHEDDDDDEEFPTRETPDALAKALRAVETRPHPGAPPAEPSAPSTPSLSALDTVQTSALAIPFDALPIPAEEVGPVPLVPSSSRDRSKDRSRDRSSIPAHVAAEEDPLLPKYGSAAPALSPPTPSRAFDSHIRPSPPKNRVANEVSGPLTPSGAFAPLSPISPRIPFTPTATPSGAFTPPPPSVRPSHASLPSITSYPGTSYPGTSYPGTSYPGHPANSEPPSIRSFVSSITSEPPSIRSFTPPGGSASHLDATFHIRSTDRDDRVFSPEALKRKLEAYRPEMPPRDWLYVIVPIAIAVGVAIGLAIVFIRLVS